MVQLVKIVTPSTTENRVKLHNKDEKLISIIIPLYNEENSILNVINRIPNNIRKEIIIVDDGSTDNSVKKIQELENDDVKIIQHEKNRGYGAAILTGFKEAKGDIIITMDSDGQMRPEEIPNIIAPILQNNADLVIGSRYLGACNFPVPFYKRLGEFCINICLWVLFRQTISNNQNGFRAYNKRAFIVFEDIKSVGMGFSTEIIFNAAYHNLHIMDVPMTGDPREFGSSYVNVLEILKSIIILISIFACKKLGPLLKRTRLLWLLKRILGILQKKGLI